jgi:hypothetical protein
VFHHTSCVRHNRLWPGSIVIVPAASKAPGFSKSFLSLQLSAFSPKSGRHQSHYPRASDNVP